MWPFTGKRVLFLYDAVDCTGDEIYACFIHGTIDPVLCVIVDCLGNEICVFVHGTVDSVLYVIDDC